MKQKGFTLIEIIIAMVIIGILVTAASLNYEKVRAKSRDTKRKADISNLAIALESYYSFERKYPGERHMDYRVDATANPPAWQDPIGDNDPNNDDSLLPYLNPLPIEQGPNFGDSYIGDNPCLTNNSATNAPLRNYNYHTEECANGSATAPCSSELVGGYILIARLELYDDPDISTTAQSGCGSLPIIFGTNSPPNNSRTLTGHPLFILSK